MARHTISLPDRMSDYVEGRVGEGQYGNLSEYFRDLVRKEQEQRRLAIEELREILDRAERSGISECSPDEIRARIRKTSAA